MAADTGVLIKHCMGKNCVSAYQDEHYGKGMRVFNIGTKKAHCTVCGAESDCGSGVNKTEKK